MHPYPDSLCGFTALTIRQHIHGHEFGINGGRVEERVFSIVTKPETGLELFGLVQRHIAGLHERGMSRMVGYELMSNGRVILVKVRAASGQGLPSDEEVEMVLDGEFVDRIEPLAQELVDGFHMPSFAHCPSERKG